MEIREREEETRKRWKGMRKIVVDDREGWRREEKRHRGGVKRQKGIGKKVQEAERDEGQGKDSQDELERGRDRSG